MAKKKATTDISYELWPWKTRAANLDEAAERLVLMKRARQKTGNLVKRQSKVNAPKDTGALASSVTYRSFSTTGIMFESRLPYANPIHWGWRKHNIEPTWFLLNAARETEPQWYKFWDLEVKEAVSDI